jgi:hypothetical protein
MESASENAGKENAVEGIFAGIILSSATTYFELLAEAVRRGVTEYGSN